MGRFTSWAIMFKGFVSHVDFICLQEHKLHKDRATRIGKQIWPRTCIRVVEAKEGYSSKLQKNKVGKSKT
jgi:hypothetical protein